MAAVETNQRLVKFIVASVLFFAWGVIQGALQAQKPIHDFIAQGPASIIVGAHTHINLLGWVSLIVAALIYYLVPILTNKSIAAPRLIEWVFWIWVLTLAVMSILMLTVGIRAGNAFTAGVVGPKLEALMSPYMMVIGMLSIVGAIIMLIFVGQILVSVARKTS